MRSLAGNLRVFFAMAVGAPLLVAASSCCPASEESCVCTPIEELVELVDECFRGRWEVGGAALWQQNVIDNYSVLDGLTSVTPGGTGSVVNNSHTLFDIFPKFYWGFEVWLGWNSCNGCHAARVVYKRIHSYNDSKTFGGLSGFTSVFGNHIPPFPVGAIPNLTTVIAQQKTQFDSVHAYYSRTLACNCRARLCGRLGGRYVGIGLSRGYFTQAPLPTGTGLFTGSWGARERSRFDGGGVEVGFAGDYTIGCGFGLVGSAELVALFGNRKDVFSTVFTTGGTLATPTITTQNYSRRHFTRTVIGADLRAGVNYTYDLRLCGCCIRLLGEVGWQLDYFWRALGLRLANYPRSTGEIMLDVDTQSADFGNNGLYIALSARF